MKDKPQNVVKLLMQLTLNFCQHCIYLLFVYHMEIFTVYHFSHLL